MPWPQQQQTAQRPQPTLVATANKEWAVEQIVGTTTVAMHETSALAYEAAVGGEVICNGVMKSDNEDLELPVEIQQHEEETVLVCGGGGGSEDEDQEHHHHLLSLPDIQELTSGDTIFILCGDDGREESAEIAAYHNGLNR